MNIFVSKMSYIKTVITALFIILTIGLASVYARDKNAKCHKCKDTDLKLVDKHKMLGYDGCLTCHKGPLKDDMKENGEKLKPKK
jgi:hypothetical protein